MVLVDAPPEKTRVRGLPPPRRTPAWRTPCRAGTSAAFGRSAPAWRPVTPRARRTRPRAGGARARDPRANLCPRRPSRGRGVCPPRASTAVWRGRVWPASPPAAPAASEKTRRPPRTPRRSGKDRAPDVVTRGTGPGKTAEAGASRWAHPAIVRLGLAGLAARQSPPTRARLPTRLCLHETHSADRIVLRRVLCRRRHARACFPCGSTGRAHRRVSTRSTATRCGFCPQRKPTRSQPPARREAALARREHAMPTSVMRARPQEAARTRPSATTSARFDETRACAFRSKKRLALRKRTRDASSTRRATRSCRAPRA